MKDSDSSSQISFSSFQFHLHGYEAHVPKKIHRLEDIRFRELPGTLDQRKKAGEAFLERTEVMALVEWKLKHGTYRPNLAKLVASNSATDVRATTKSAFEVYEAHKEDYDKSITALSKLKGIGPATASLLLSSYDPMAIPFFSDEIYRYVLWEEAKLKGWDRKINYTIKEYRALFERVAALRKRLEEASGEIVSAVHIEKAAYVLGKNALPNSPGSSRVTEDAEDDKTLVPPSPKRRKKATPKS
ncbi:hypothetical protein BDR22DRAFT_839743 [Usnea florida]